MEPLYDQIVRNEIDPKSILTHEMPLEKAAKGYKKFNNREDDCIKVILKP